MADYTSDASLSPSTPPTPEDLRRPRAKAPVNLAEIESAITTATQSAQAAQYRSPTSAEPQMSSYRPPLPMVETTKTVVQYTGTALKVDAVCLTDADAEKITKAIAALAPLLPKAGG